MIVSISVPMFYGMDAENIATSNIHMGTVRPKSKQGNTEHLFLHGK